MKMDPDLIIPNKQLSIQQGGHPGQRLELCEGGTIAADVL